jgi:hypothetical protein
MISDGWMDGMVFWELGFFSFGGFAYWIRMIYEDAAMAMAMMAYTAACAGARFVMG